MAELFLFNDNGSYHAFTNGYFATTFDGRTYEPLAIKRSKIQITDNLAKSPVTISLPRSNIFALKVLTANAEVPITVVIYKNGAVLWQGIVMKPKATFSTIDLSCDSEWAALLKNTNTYAISPLCQHQLYSPQCGVIDLLWKTSYADVTVTSTTIEIVTMDKPSGYYTNGSMEFNGEKRRILKHENTTFTITTPFISSGTGIVSLLPGCALTETSCKFFNNLDNHLGFARIPNKNPFNSTGLL